MEIAALILGILLLLLYVWRLLEQGFENLRKGHLRGKSHRGKNYRGCDFHQCDLSRLDFSGCDLSEGNMQEANLQGANLERANLRNACLKYADLQGAVLDKTDLRGADFNGAKTYWSSFEGALIDQNTRFDRDNEYRIKLAVTKTARNLVLWQFIDLTRAYLKNVDFSNMPVSCDLSMSILYGSDFRGAKLTGAKFHHTSTHGVLMDETTQIDPKWKTVWEIINCGASGKDLAGFDLSGADLRGADFRKANLTNANLTDTLLDGANFESAILVGATFANAIIGEKTILDEKWKPIVLAVAQNNPSWLKPKMNLSGANFHDFNFQGINLTDANLSRARLRNAILTGVNLQGADLTEADMTNADLNYADLKGAIVFMEQIKSARTTIGTVMPDGQKFG